MLIHRRVFDNVGLLDENYFLYLEDVDFCWRASKAGFKIVFNAKSKIYHKVNISTTRSNSLLPLYYTIRNRLYFAKKNLGVFYYLSFFYLIISMKIKMLSKNQKDKKQYIFIRALSDFEKNEMGRLKTEL
jgi:GT2 family glycosyltransferase